MQEILVMLDDLAWLHKRPHERLVHMSIHEKIKAARVKLGMSMDALATAISSAEGLKKPLAWQTVQQWESGKSAPRRLRLEVVAKILQIPVNELLADVNHSALPQLIDLEAHPELVLIRRVKLKVQAGVSGISIEPEHEDGQPIFFREAWIQNRGFKAYNLIALKVGGSSMEPTLFQDDMIVANTADQEPKDGEVFVVNNEGEAVIKRLSRDNGIWWLCSDNADQRRYPRKECGTSCIIVGRVIHKQSERI